PFQHLPEEPHRSGRAECVERCAAVAEGDQDGRRSCRGPDGPELVDRGEEPVTTPGPVPVHRPKEVFIQVSGFLHGRTAYRLAPVGTSWAERGSHRGPTDGGGG